MKQITREYDEADQEVCALLVFRLGEQMFALHVETVVQVIPMLRLTPIPQVEGMIEGVANIHGVLVPVISARRHLGLPELKPGLYTPIVLAVVGTRQIGWIVDEVTDIISVPAGSIIETGNFLPEGMEHAPVMSGLVYQQGCSVVVLDPRYILRPSEFRQIEQVCKPSPQASAAFPAMPSARTVELPQAEVAVPAAIDSARAALLQKQAASSPEEPEAKPMLASMENADALIAPPAAAQDHSSTAQPVNAAVETTVLFAGETKAAALPEPSLPLPATESPSNNGAEETPTIASPPAAEDKPAKRASRKGKIIPNTANSLQAQGLIARRSLQAVLAEQFAALAVDVQETDKTASSELSNEPDQPGELQR